MRFPYAIKMDEVFGTHRCATVDDARFVKMNMGLDQPRTGEASPGVVNLGLASERVLEGDDTTLSAPISIGSPDGRSARRALRTIRSTWDSLGLDVGRFDQRPPFLDLGLLMSSQRFCSLLLRWRNFLTEVG